MMTLPLRRSSGWITAAVLLVLALALAGSVQAPAGTSVLPAGTLAPTDIQRATARRIGRILEEAHYSRAALDDRMSDVVYHRYLEFLDGQRSYFLANDIEDFNAYRLRFGDMIRTGDIDPAYLIFARFQQRNRERLQQAVELLKSEPEWAGKESFDFDRTHAAWPVDQAAMEELWRKRVKNDALSLMLTGKAWPDAAEVLRKRYERVLKRVDQVTSEDVFEGLMNAYARAFDPHSSYFSPRSSEEYRIQMSLNYEGIGASLQIVDDYVTIMNVLEGGPAAMAGTLTTNDRITGVGQGHDGAFTDVIGWRLDDVLKLLRDLKSENVDGLLVDLRGDGGGYLPEATALTGLFINHGPVVQLRDTAGRLEVLDDPEPAPAYDGPLAVLVDRLSASASEIFAGAIQDYHRGVILGQTTFGKGTVQNLVPLDRWSPKPVNGQLTVTIGKFYRVTGESTQHRGVEPDVPLASPMDIKEIGESALESALPWDRIAGVPFRMSAGTAAAPPVAALATEEDARAQHDPDYRWLVSDIAAIGSVRGQHSVSLNLKARREERARIESERLARENSRRAAKNLPPLKSVEELDKSKDEAADVVLEQATQVMADMVTGAHPQQPPQKTARAS